MNLVIFKEPGPDSERDKALLRTRRIKLQLLVSLSASVYVVVYRENP
jgi:hypothetical protein